eukprot:TRINITY_DN5604_c0_g1_i13.p1 TRINITY_DN5604_c0_g1~~TRINITY_DN5604_c0_g1_i13.p1  ORF type:complete len:308 (-),score=43.57 TRINITY_DN5604_c0_g1_i13:186-1109(-)
MYETDQIPSDWGEMSRFVDEVWIPTNFLVSPFEHAGYTREKIVVVPCQIDTYFWDPSIIDPSNLSIYTFPSATRDGDFLFLSSFKWEFRKGWDVLLEAYFQEFSSKDKIFLYLHTYLWDHPDPRNSTQVQYVIDNWLATIDNPIIQKKWKNGNLPRYAFITNYLPSMEVPGLFRAVDAFILPSRGEGWGLPIMQGMAMGLPVITTRCTGQVDFVDSSVGYLIDVKSTISQKDFSGMFAQPDVNHTSELMREVFTNREEAKRVGKRAQEHIINNFSSDVVSQIFLRHFRRFERFENGKKRSTNPFQIS